MPDDSAFGNGASFPDRAGSSQTSMSDPEIPDFYVSRPAGWSHDDVEAFERVWVHQVQPGAGGAIDYQLDAPKWMFLCWLAETKDVLLHGSGRADIRSFEPRRARDISEFGGRRAVFAASDGIWAMFFAIAKRRAATSLVNAAFSVDIRGASKSFYYFSINREAFDPWQEGAVYVLPRSSFDRAPDEEWLGAKITSHHWASDVLVRPMASLAVTPVDFPLLNNVNTHDRDTVAARELANPNGFPWRDEQRD